MKTVKLHEICVFKNGINFQKTDINNPCKILGVADFKNRYYADYSQLDVVDRACLKADDYLQDNDILFVRSNGNKSLVGRSLYIKDLKEDITFSGFCIRLRVTSPEINPKYLYYLTKTNLFKAKFGKTQQTNINNLSQDILKDIEISIPNIETQNTIVDTLDSFIDKTLNNEAICYDLEAMAKLLYDYWFVQFDFPDENGKPYKSSGGKMVWNDDLKKEIPEGWEVKILGDIADMYQPKTFDAKLLEKEGEYRVYGAGGYMGQYHEYNHENSEIFISCRGSCGNVYKSMPKSLITGNAMIVNPYDKDDKEYLYWSLVRFGVKNCITGSVQPQITRDELSQWKIVLPSKKNIKMFNVFTSQISEIVTNITDENQQLASLRDFLLPMLMNGQVKIQK